MVLVIEGKDAVMFMENYNKPPAAETIQMFKDAKKMAKRIRWDN